MSDSSLAAIVSDLGAIIAMVPSDDRAWQLFTDRFAEAVPGARVLLHASDMRRSRTVPLVYSNFDALRMEQFASYYGAINAWAPLNARIAPMQIYGSEKFLPASSFSESEFYRDWLRHVGECDGATGIKILGAEERSASLAIHYDARSDEKFAAVIAPILRVIAPQIRTSLDKCLLKLERSHFVQTGTLLQQLFDAAFIVDTSGRVVSANASADALMKTDCGLSIGANNNLSIRDAKIDGVVKSEVMRVIKSPTSASLHHSIRMRIAEETFQISIYPISSTSEGGSVFAGMSPKRNLALIVVRLVSTTDGIVETLRRQFKLTSAESRVALLLANGSSISQASGDLSITYNTGRTHQKSLYAKLGISRQSELVALLLPLIGGIF